MKEPGQLCKWRSCNLAWSAKGPLLLIGWHEKSIFMNRPTEVQFTNAYVIPFRLCPENAAAHKWNRPR